MRYGNPGIPERLQVLKDSGCEKVLVVPLYPQYSATTTASVCDRTFEAMEYCHRLRSCSGATWRACEHALPRHHEATHTHPSERHGPSVSTKVRRTSDPT